MKNFEKPLQDFTEKELLNGINNWHLQAGMLASYELLRRLALENDKSSKRYAKWSLIISIIAIILSLVASTIQIYFAWPKTEWCSISTSDPKQHCEVSYWHPHF